MRGVLGGSAVARLRGLAVSEPRRLRSDEIVNLLTARPRNFETARLRYRAMYSGGIGCAASSSCQKIVSTFQSSPTRTS
jgi:hypothetical protein